MPIDIDASDDWIVVNKKTKNNMSKNDINKQLIITFDSIKNTINTTLSKYKILYIFIYGSRARGTNRIDSDVDIMCFMKYPIPNLEKLSEIKKELIFNLGLNIDLVIMQLTNKKIKVTDERMRCYYENVIIDAKSIYPENNIKQISELIDKSIKVEKIE